MDFYRSLLSLYLLVLFSSTAHAASSPSIALSSYTLNAGDLISVRVFEEDDLSIEARLTDAGTISYPFLGEVTVRDLTVGQLEQLITRGLRGDYLVNPRVNVTILEYRKFFVRGEVKKPGGFSFEPGLTLEKAIALAGGFSARANKKDIYVTRKANGLRQKQRLAIDSAIYPGDIINIEESFF